MIPMRTDLNTGGFTLYEIMISITIVGIITGLLSVSLFPLLDRSEFVNTADQIKDSLRQAQWLALNRRESSVEKRIRQTTPATKKQRQL